MRFQKNNNKSILLYFYINICINMFIMSVFLSISSCYSLKKIEWYKIHLFKVNFKWKNIIFSSVHYSIENKKMFLLYLLYSSAQENMMSKLCSFQELRFNVRSSVYINNILGWLDANLHQQRRCGQKHLQWYISFVWRKLASQRSCEW